MEVNETTSQYNTPEYNTRIYFDVPLLRENRSALTRSEHSRCYLEEVRPNLWYQMYDGCVRTNLCPEFPENVKQPLFD